MRWLGLLAVVGLVGCGDNKSDDEPTELGSSNPTEEPGSPTSEETPTETTPDAVVWYGMVEPVVRENCVTCHQADGIGAFELETFEMAKAWGPAMANAVADGRMPPWLAKSDGSCGDFADSAALEPSEIALIVDWVDGGMLEGDVSLAVSDPLPEPEHLPRIDLSVAVPTDFVPVKEGTLFAKNDEYRCFLFDNGNTEDVFLTGFEVAPGFDPIVHHVIVMNVDPEASSWAGTRNAEEISSMNGADGREGWDCLGTAGGNIRESGYPVTWAPGLGATEFPEGTGIRLAAGEQLIMQVHYNLVDPANEGIVDDTLVHFTVEEDVEEELLFALPDGFLESLFEGIPDTLPPGVEEYEYSWSTDGRDILWYGGIYGDQVPETFKVWGVLPHMHELGQSMTMQRRSDEQCMVDVPKWDFNWQLQYWFEEPMVMSSDEIFDVSCVFDTSEKSSITLPGWGTGSEMCLMGMVFSVEL